MKKANEGQRDEYGYLARSKKGLTKLECDLCGKEICWVYDFDLNESFFYCDECYKKIPEFYFPV